MDKTGQFKIMKIRDEEECKDVVMAHVDQIVFSAVVFYAIIAFHFQIVVYTYWKRAYGQSFEEQVDEENALGDAEDGR